MAGVTQEDYRGLFHSSRQQNFNLKQKENLRDDQLRRLGAEVSALKRTRAGGAGAPNLRSAPKPADRDTEDYIKMLEQDNRRLKRSTKSKEQARLSKMRGVRPSTAKPKRHARSKPRPSPPTRQQAQTPMQSPPMPQQYTPQQEHYMPSMPNERRTMHNLLKTIKSRIEDTEDVMGVPADQRIHLDQPPTPPSGPHDHYAMNRIPSYPDLAPQQPHYQQSSNSQQTAAVTAASNEDLARIRAELREKKTKIAVLASQFEQMQASFRAEKEIQSRALEQAQTYKHQLMDQNRLAARLKNRIKDLECNEDQVRNLTVFIQDLQATNASLEERVRSLAQNAFASDQLEQQRLKSLVGQYTVKVDEVQQRHAEKSAKIESLEFDLQEKQRLLSEARATGDKVETARRKTAAELQAAQKKIQSLQDKVNVFSEDSGIDFIDLEEALDIVMRRKEDPTKVDFLEGSGDSLENLSPAALRRRVSDLELSFKQATLEVESRDSVIAVQNRQIEDQASVLAAKDGEIEQLQHTIFRLEDAIRNGQASGAGFRDDESISNMSMFSDMSEISMGGVENLIAFRVESGSLDSDFTPFSDGKPITIVATDFYDFETSFSGAFGGLQPQYSFNTQYRVQMDAFFLEFASRECVSVEVYQQCGTDDITLVARAEISLVSLLSHAPGRTLNGRAQLVGVERFRGSNAGSISWSAKMFRPLEDGTDTESLANQSMRKSLPRPADSSSNSGHEGEHNQPGAETDSEREFQVHSVSNDSRDEV